MIVVVIGRAGTGKTVVSKEICKLTGLPLIETSDFLKAITGGKQRCEMNLSKDQFEKDDPDWLWKHMESRIREVGNCVVSGIREPYLLHKLLTVFDDVNVVGLEATSFTRYSRLCSRDGFISVEDFRLTDTGTLKDRFVGDTTLGLDITLTRCDILVDANQDLDGVKRQVQAYLFDRGIIRRSNRRSH